MARVLRSSRRVLASSNFYVYKYAMKIEYDRAKRAWTLKERGIDFKAAEAVFEGPAITVEDFRHDYGERRFVTVGLLNERVVIVIWTPRGTAAEPVRRIISMRKANAREVEVFWDQLQEDGRDSGRS